mgnify:CR=1 FL=1
MGTVAASVSLVNPVGAPMPRATLGLVVQAFRRAWPRARGAAVTVALVDRAESRRLNRVARGRNAPTDVLSFPAGDEPHWPQPPHRWLGEVVICYPIAVRQAREFGHSVRREVVELLAHGLAHLAGFDHKTPKAAQAMAALETKIVTAVFQGLASRGG